MWAGCGLEGDELGGAARWAGEWKRRLETRRDQSSRWVYQAGSRKHLSRPGQEYLKCHIGLCLELRCEYLRSGSGCGSDKVL
jgi:hypothetical protein